jgi:hypothetical protein
MTFKFEQDKDGVSVLVTMPHNRTVLTRADTIEELGPMLTDAMCLQDPWLEYPRYKPEKEQLYFVALRDTDMVKGQWQLDVFADGKFQTFDQDVFAWIEIPEMHQSILS